MLFSSATDISTSTFIPNGFSVNGRGMLTVIAMSTEK